jgi:hypothetical protein
MARTAALALAAALSGCYESFPAVEDAPGDGDATSADDAAGDVSMTDRSEDAAVDAVADGPICSSDDDCVVALRVERCCDPGPSILLREEFEHDECLWEPGTALPDRTDCWTECYACSETHDVAYDARCDGGHCVAVTDFAPPMAAPEPAAHFSASQVAENPDILEPYWGRTVSIEGTWTPGPDTCTCCLTCMCTCFDSPVHPTLDCAVTLDGSVSGLAWSCTGDECDFACTPTVEPRYLRAVGWIIPMDVGGPRLWVFSYEFLGLD